MGRFLVGRRAAGRFLASDREGPSVPGPCDGSAVCSFSLLEWEIQKAPRGVAGRDVKKKRK